MCKSRETRKTNGYHEIMKLTKSRFDTENICLLVWPLEDVSEFSGACLVACFVFIMILGILLWMLEVQGSFLITWTWILRPPPKKKFYSLFLRIVALSCCKSGSERPSSSVSGRVCGNWAAQPEYYLLCVNPYFTALSDKGLRLLTVCPLIKLVIGQCVPWRSWNSEFFYGPL
jgi:hypothetical protein